MRRTTTISPLLLAVFGPLVMRAQPPIITVPDAHSYGRTVREAKVALERALIEQDADSIAYWRAARYNISSFKLRDTLPLLDDQERTLLNFGTAEFASVLSDIDQRRHYFRSQYRKPYDRNKTPGDALSGWFSGPNLNHGLRDFWLVRSPNVIDAIAGSDLDAVDREFLTLYWQATMNALYDFPTDTIFPQRSINERANALLAQDPGYRYAPELKEHIRRQFKQARVGLGVAWSGGTNVLLGGLDRHFTEANNFAFNFEVTYLNWVFQATGMSLDAKLERDLVVDDAVWQTGKGVNSNFSGFGVGHVFFNGRVGRLVPSLGLGTAGLTYYEDPDEDFRIETASFMRPVAEVLYDLKLDFMRSAKKNRDRVTLLAENEEAYWFLRFRVGASPTGFGPHIGPQGAQLYFAIGFGGYWRGLTLDRK